MRNKVAKNLKRLAIQDIGEPEMKTVISTESIYGISERIVPSRTRRDYQKKKAGYGTLNHI